MSKKESPADETEPFVLPKDFIPMSLPQQRLQAPERPGYHRHWFRGTPERIAQAQRAYYRFVEPDEVELNNFDVGGDAKVSGNTDMGSRVSVIDGEDTGRDGQPGRLYLMECRQEYYEASQKILADRNRSIAEALTAGLVGAGQGGHGETNEDIALRYVKGKVPDMFNPYKRRPNGPA